MQKISLHEARSNIARCLDEITEYPQCGFTIYEVENLLGFIAGAADVVGPKLRKLVYVLEHPEDPDRDSIPEEAFR